MTDEAHNPPDHRRTLATSAFPSHPNAPLEPASLPAGTRVAHYTIDSVIGVGGMGAVYAATQDKPHRTVALKLIRPGFANQKQLRRFEIEAEILARLNHPGIAQVYDAGVAETPLGAQPYFAMELVRGRPLRVYADVNRLSPRDRLILFAQICDAVEHAHQKGIIHRDLKPSNIMVTNEGQVKILDFGVARVTDADLQTTTVHTDVGTLIGTITYMSPEQASGDPAELDTRSDVYALGIVLYELLAGRLPYDIARKMLHEAVRIIREDDPAPISSVNRVFKGDVDTILFTALAKEKLRRYQSAADLADDIRRYLENKPINARRPSTIYQLRKFSRRNKALVLGVVATFLVLVAGVITTSWQAREARANARAAKANAAEAQAKTLEAEAFNDFIIQRMFGAVDPDVAKGHDVTVRQILDTSARHTDDIPNPVVRATVLQTIGDVYEKLTLYDEAAEKLQRALDIRQSLDPDDPALAETRIALARTLEFLGKNDESERLDRQALDSLNASAGADDASIATAASELAGVLYRRGKNDEVDGLYQSSLQHFAAAGADANPTEEYAAALAGYAVFLQNKGDFARSRDSQQRALDIRLALHGEDNSMVANSLANLGTVYADLEDYDKAEELIRRSIEIRKRILPEQHDHHAQSLVNLGVTLMKAGRFDAAEKYMREGLADYRTAYGDSHPAVTATLIALGANLFHAGKYTEAEPVFAEALALSEKLYPGDNWKRANAMSQYANCLTSLARYEEAEPLLIEADRILESTNSSPLATKKNLGRLVRLYQDWKRPEEADRWQHRLDELATATP